MDLKEMEYKMLKYKRKYFRLKNGQTGGGKFAIGSSVAVNKTITSPALPKGLVGKIETTHTGLGNQVFYSVKIGNASHNLNENDLEVVVTKYSIGSSVEATEQIVYEGKTVNKGTTGKVVDIKMYNKENQGYVVEFSNNRISTKENQLKPHLVKVSSISGPGASGTYKFKIGDKVRMIVDGNPNAKKNSRGTVLKVENSMGDEHYTVDFSRDVPQMSSVIVKGNSLQKIDGFAKYKNKDVLQLVSNVDSNFKQNDKVIVTGDATFQNGVANYIVVKKDNTSLRAMVEESKLGYFNNIEIVPPVIPLPSSDTFIPVTDNNSKKRKSNEISEDVLLSSSPPSPPSIQKKDVFIPPKKHTPPAKSVSNVETSEPVSLYGISPFDIPGLPFDKTLDPLRAVGYDSPIKSTQPRYKPYPVASPGPSNVSFIPKRDPQLDAHLYKNLPNYRAVPSNKSDSSNLSPIQPDSQYKDFNLPTIGINVDEVLGTPDSPRLVSPTTVTAVGSLGHGVSTTKKPVTGMSKEEQKAKFGVHQ